MPVAIGAWRCPVVSMTGEQCFLAKDHVGTHLARVPGSRDHFEFSEGGTLIKGNEGNLE